MVGRFRGIGIRRVMGEHGNPWKYLLGVNVVLRDKVQPSFWKSGSESTRSMISIEWALRSTSEVWKDTQAPGSALIGIKHDGSVNGIFYFNGRSQTFASCVRSHNLSLGITLLQALELRHQTTSTKDEEVVLCPLSLTDGWVSEINRFTPKLEALRYVGDKDFRRALRKSKHGHVNKSSKLEKALWELRSENSENKFTADSKLTEVLVRSVGRKIS